MYWNVWTALEKFEILYPSISYMYWITVREAAWNLMKRNKYIYDFINLIKEQLQ